MRDRAFGVEIECGYNGSERECTCECTCYTCSFCNYGCEETLAEDEECTCECACEPCDFCHDGCSCGRDYRYNGCDVAYDLLATHGYMDWLGGIHEDGSGVEIPSPILKGSAGLRELRSVMELLRTNGFYTTGADGLHVHHDAPEFVGNEELTAHLVELWEENLSLIDNFVSYRRRGGRYWACHSYKVVSPRRWEDFKATKRLGALDQDKFRSLNITPLQWHGTIEFRLHEGTLNFAEAAAWIHFGQSFLDMAKRRRSVVTCDSALDLLKLSRTSKRATQTLLAKADNNKEAYAYA